MPNRKVVKKRKKFVLIGAVALVLVAGLVILIVSVAREGQPKETSLLETLEGYKGYIRQVGQEEYDFYTALVMRDLTEELSAEELDAKVKEYINTVNATFYLGNRLGLCESYSFQGLQNQMQHENDSRKMKKEKGEPIYGLEQFDLTSYFQYVKSNLEVELMNYLVEHADNTLIEQAKAYFEADPDAYREVASITYHVTENGQTTLHTASQEEIRTLQNQDGELFDFLAEAEQGDSFTYEVAGSEREVEVISIEYQGTTFEESQTTILRDYIQEQVYKNLIATIAKNNPVEFDLN